MDDLQGDDLADNFSAEVSVEFQHQFCSVLCRLYITVGKAEEAVSMYKQMKMFGDMVRLVKQYFPEHLDATHLQLAKVTDLLTHQHADLLITCS